MTLTHTTKLAAIAAGACIALTPAQPALANTSPRGLGSLPGALVTPTHAPLTVELPAHVSPTALRAAIIAAGAVQHAAGSPGLQVRVVEGQTPAATPGPVIAIDERTGTPSLSLTGLKLTISGSGTGLLTAARVLSSPAIAALRGTTATVPADIAPERTSGSAAHGETVAPSTVKGSGQLSLSSTFNLPVDQQIAGEAPLRLGIGYDAPNGGRVTVSLNGNVLGAFDVSGSGTIRKTETYKLADDPSLSGDLLPGWWLQPGANKLTVSVHPSGPDKQAPASLQLLQGSRLALKTRPRPQALQLGLWPFPIYDSRAWSAATVVINPSAGADTLSALIGALSNSERITGAPADPQVAFAVPSAAQRAGNLIIVDSGAQRDRSLLDATATLASIKPTQPPLAGVLEEDEIPGGGVAMIAHGARALNALAQGYQPAAVNGRAILIDASGHAHTLAGGQSLPLFKQPRWPWLAPSAFLALLALGWLGLRAARARRRLAAMTPLATEGASA